MKGRQMLLNAACAMALACFASPLLSNDQDPPAAPPPCKRAAPAAGGKVITANERSQGKELTLSLADTLEIRLASIPGTGYGWKVDGSAPAIVCLESERLDLAGASVAGAAATSIFRFVPVRAGAGTIKLAYLRVWEKGIPPKKTYTLPLRVR